MSEQLNRGQHIEADSLNALLEGVLPEHERLDCLAHLAECTRCREIVFLAQEPQPAVVAPSAAPWWQRWFAPFPVLGGTAVAGALAVGAWFYMHRAPAPIPYVVVRPGPAQPLAPPPLPRAAAPQPNAKRESPKSDRLATEREAAPRTARDFDDAPRSAPALAAPMAQAAPPPPPPPPAPIVQGPAVNFAVLPPPPPTSASSGPLRLSVQHNRSSAGDLSEVAGSVTDPSGAAIPKADVTLRQIAGTSNGSAQTDERGQFNLSALPPGRYELQIAAPGFQTASGQIELQAQDRAVVAPVLSIGSVAETVEVTAASASLQTSTATVAKAPRAATGLTDLPTFGRNVTLQDLEMKPGGTTIARGKLMLTLTSAGALSFSKDGGKHWKAVKQPWAGRVIQLTTQAESPTNPEAFQITTDSASVWLSRDGVHWFADQPQR